MHFNPRRESKISVPQLILLSLGILIISITGACSSSTADEGNLAAAVESVEDNPESDSEITANASIGAVNSIGDAVNGGFSIDPSSESNPQEENEPAESALATFPSMSIQEENTHLETALSMVPADALQFRFSHWNRLKRHNRVPEMTSDFEMLDRKRFMVQVLTKNQAAAVMDKDFFEVQANLWGWDSSDLVWEAEAQFASLIDYLNILRLRPNFDLEALADLLLEREFTPVAYEGITIYSMALTEEVDWYNISPLSIHYIAIFPDEDILIMSPVIESVQKTIDTMRGQQPAIWDDPLVKRAAFQLVGMAAVELQRGIESCEYYSAGNSDKGRLINAATEQLDNWPVYPYQLMALGHAFSNDLQVDLVIFHYDDFRQAELDFEFRENLLRLGTSPERNVPYSAQFILQDAELDDALMTFSLVPSPTLGDRSGWPQTLIGWVQDQDALFAACVIEDFLGLDEMN